MLKDKIKMVFKDVFGFTFWKRGNTWSILGKQGTADYNDEELVLLRKVNGWNPYCKHHQVARQFGHWCHEPKDDAEWTQFYIEKEQNHKDAIQRLRFHFQKKKSP